jgi:hypothetical protein
VIVDATATIIASTPDSIIAHLRWRDSNQGEWQSRYQVFRFRAGRIVDMGGCRTEQTARRAARR